MIRGTDRRRYHHHDNFHGIHQHYCHYVVDLNGSCLFRSHEMQNLSLLGSYIFHDYHAMKWRMNNYIDVWQKKIIIWFTS